MAGALRASSSKRVSQASGQRLDLKSADLTTGRIGQPVRSARRNRSHAIFPRCIDFLGIPDWLSDGESIGYGVREPRLSFSSSGDYNTNWV